jgi:hypothetical protein
MNPFCARGKKPAAPAPSRPSDRHRSSGRARRARHRRRDRCADPPLAGIAAGAEGREARRTWTVAASAILSTTSAGNRRVAVDLAAIQHQLAQPSQIAQARRDAAARKGHALAVDRLIGVLFHAHPAPEPLGGQLGHRLAGDAADDPAQHVGIDGLVVERVTVLALGLDLLQVFPIAVRPVIAAGLGSGLAAAE